MMSSLPGCASRLCTHYNECQHRIACDRLDEYRSGLDDVDREDEDDESNERNEEDDTR